MKLLLRWLPSSLVGRVFSLYFTSLLIFVTAGLGLFYQNQFSQNIENQLIAAETMMNVAAQSVADSVVIGDYDTITKTLELAIARSHFSGAQFIDVNGGAIKAVNQSKTALNAPAWLRAQVQAQLFDVNQNIAVGGKDYGVLRLSFAADVVAAELWRLALLALGVALGALVGGMVLIWVPLKRWLGNFDRVRAHEPEILSGAIKVSALLDTDAPVEIRHTFDIVSRAASRLLAQREEAAVTLNAITEGVLTTDEFNRVRYCNPAAGQLLGLPAAAAIGQDVQQLLPAAFTEQGAAADWTLRRLQVTGPQGNPIILDTSRSVIKADERVVGHVLAWRDVTAQHALDEQLRQELQTRRRALDSLRRVLSTIESPDAPAGAVPLPADDLDALSLRVVDLLKERELGRRALDNQKFALDQHAIVSITDLTGCITYANDRFCEISGFSREELLGRNHRIVNSGEHPVAFFESMWDTLLNGQVWHGEICNRSKQGGLYWLDATHVPLLGADGRPEQFIAIRTDITARKVIEAQLEDQLRFVEVLLETTPTAIYLKDTGGRYLRFNKAFEDLAGVTRSQWIGKTVFDMVPGSGAAQMDAADQVLFQTKKGQSYEASFTNHTTGETRIGLYVKEALTNNQGEVTGLVGTILDITERNRLEQTLREAKRAAEAASQAKSDFLANMSHEIRTPMNGVIGMTDLALDTALNPVQREYLTIVKNSAQSLMVILNDVLDFSKIEAGKLDIESIAFSVTDTLAETLKTLVARAEHKGLALVLEPTPGLPSQVRGDPGRIRQVLTNLCDNAIKFTAQGSVTVKAHCTALDDDAFELQFSVRDTGVGIAVEKQQGVFEAFQQADTSTTRQFGGTGLGLTICARLVALMGGRIWVESTPGQGSTFHFTVRVQGAAVPDTVAALPVPHPIGSLPLPVQTTPLKILLVEDHPINQKLAMTLLKKWGYETVLAQNGQEAVDLFPTQAWDVVLMDMQMPVMGGIDATRLIRASEPVGQHTPIVAMTANAMDSDQQACFDAGMDAHLAKPFNASGLQAIIERVVAQGSLPHVNGPAGLA